MVGRILTGMVMLVAMLLAVQGVAIAQTSAPDVPMRESYQIGLGDVLEVGVVGREEYKARVQVQDDGTIQLPLISNVQAAGRTVLELRETIRSALRSGGYYVDPAVSVTIVSYSSRYVTVLGQVKSPGIVPIDRAYRLSEIIARVGGVDNPSINTVTVTPADGQSVEYRLNDIATGGPDKDPFVNDGDKIFVAPAKTFYIYGQVNAPGNYPIDPGMTLRMALARAGGLTNLGSERRIRVMRGEQELKRYSLSDPLLEGDVVVVGERFF